MSDRLAVFDLDDTLTYGDTLVPWLVAMTGWRRFAGAVALAGYRRLTAPAGSDRRTVFKEALQVPLLAGVTEVEAVARAVLVAPRLRWRRETATALERHLREGARVLVATGAARLAAEQFIRLRFGDSVTLIGTELELSDGQLTGRLAGGNCVRQEKARRVQAWLEAHGPFGESWGYGNAPHDLPMLALVDHAMVI